MPRNFVFKAAFQKAFAKLASHQQTLVLKALEVLTIYFQTGQAPHGFRIKKLYSSGQHQIFEGRASLDIRIVWVQTKEEVIFALVGGHDDVRRFIKRL